MHVNPDLDRTSDPRIPDQSASAGASGEAAPLDRNETVSG